MIDNNTVNDKNVTVINKEKIFYYQGFHLLHLFLNFYRAKLYFTFQIFPLSN